MRNNYSLLMALATVSLIGLQLPATGQQPGAYDAKAALENLKAGAAYESAGQTEMAVDRYIKVGELAQKAGRSNPYALQMAKTIEGRLLGLQVRLFKATDWARTQRVLQERMKLIEMIEGTQGPRYKDSAETLSSLEIIKSRPQPSP